MNKNHFTRIVLALSVLVLAGIAVRGMLGAEKRNSVAVSGMLFFNEEPLAGADVFLVPIDPAVGSTSHFGRSDDIGQFKVIGGAPPGEYRVVVRRISAELPVDLPAEYGLGDIDAGQLAAMTSARPSHTSRATKRQKTSSTGTDLAAGHRQLPAIYSSAESTILKLQIPAEGIDNALFFLSTEAHLQLAQNPGQRQ